MEDVRDVESEVDFGVTNILVRIERFEKIDEIVEENTEGIVEEEKIKVLAKVMLVVTMIIK